MCLQPRTVPQQETRETFLAVQWLRLCASNAGGVGLIPGWGIKIPHIVHHKKKKKRINHEIRDEERMLLPTKSAL